SSSTSETSRAVPTISHSVTKRYSGEPICAGRLSTSSIEFRRHAREGSRRVTDPVVIAGAGPTGIACAIELASHGLAATCYDRGAPLDSLYHFPEEMRWFSTRDLLDIAGVPFVTPEAHPNRLESLAYYRGVAERFAVSIVPETAVEAVRGAPSGVSVRL